VWLENQRSIDPRQSGKGQFGRFVALALVAARNANLSPGIEGTRAFPGLKIANKPKVFRELAESADEDAKINCRVGSRRRHCGTVGDKAARSYRAERSETAAFVEFRGCASVGAGLRELPLESH